MSDVRVNNNMYSQINALEVERQNEFEGVREAQQQAKVRQAILTKLEPVLGEDFINSHLDSLTRPADNVSMHELPDQVDFGPSLDISALMNTVIAHTFEVNKEVKQMQNEAALHASQQQFKMQTESVDEKRAGIGLRVGLKCGGALLALGMNAKGFKSATGSAAVEGNQTAGQSWNQAGGSSEGVLGAFVDANQQSHDANMSEDDKFAELYRKLKETMTEGGQAALQEMRDLRQKLEEFQTRYSESLQKPMNSV